MSGRSKSNVDFCQAETWKVLRQKGMEIEGGEFERMVIAVVCGRYGSIQARRKVAEMERELRMIGEARGDGCARRAVARR